MDSGGFLHLRFLPFISLSAHGFDGDQLLRNLGDIDTSNNYQSLSTFERQLLDLF
jgi:hypothetical protein